MTDSNNRARYLVSVRITPQGLVFLLLFHSNGLFHISSIGAFLASNVPPAIPSSPSLSAYHDRKISVTQISDSISKSVLNPFRHPIHAPPRQQNDTYDGSSWWADWMWLSVPFSSSLTLDEDRALLPPLKHRPVIYCYYDATLKKSRDEKDAESQLLLTWRRAWWAQGFRPTILGASEAMKNPKYQELQRLEADPDLKGDLMRWLAWESMGGGLLSQYTLLPMGPSDDPLLSFLRRGEYPHLTRWQGLESGLLASKESEIGEAINPLMDPTKLKIFNSVMAAADDFFKVDSATKALAYYTPELLEEHYTKVAENIANGRAKGLGSLNRLINSHLQVAWQNSFLDGIEVLQPLPQHTTTMVRDALRLAHSLASCPDSPMPSSCPPQLPSCTPCVADSTSMKITIPSEYTNSTSAYSIGTVPHPWTLASLHNMRETLDIAWIVRDSPRDPWLAAITEHLLGLDVSGDRRVMRFKQAVADEHATVHALWLTAEADIPNDLDWHFGFSIPRKAIVPRKAAEKASYEGKEHPFEEYNANPDEDEQSDGLKPLTTPEEGLASETLSSASYESKAHPFDEYNTDPEADEQSDEAKPSSTPEEDLAREPVLLERARRIVALTKSTKETRLRASLEAWNLADTEAWKFTRAFLARRSLERAEWENEEAKYSGGAGSENGRHTWSRWRDQKTD
ncbi:hypothetical protein G7046_g7123 [Stylonectria norvegica]|nr:hypothetical protein G7046_g7123 [Stylonectria norvegica]